MSMNFSDIAILVIEILIIAELEKWSHKLNEKCWFDWKNWNINHENLFSYIKLGKEILNFKNIEIEKYKF